MGTTVPMADFLVRIHKGRDTAKTSIWQYLDAFRPQFGRYFEGTVRKKLSRKPYLHGSDDYIKMLYYKQLHSSYDSPIWLNA